MRMGKIRMAMIGCGRRAPSWFRTISAVPELEIVALCDKMPARVEDRARLLGEKRVALYSDHRKMLEEVDCEAVAVVTEPEYQASLSVEAMEAEKDVISEVPAGYSMTDCWDLVLTVERTGRVYYLAEQQRHSPMTLSWQKMVREGKLGKILFVEGHYLHAMGEDRFWVDTQTGKQIAWAEKAGNANVVKSRLWRMQHPILYGPHELSPLLKILDDRVVKVACFSTRTESYRFEEVPFPGMTEPFTSPDLEVAMMHTEKDTIMRFAAGFNAPSSGAHWYHLMGTKGDVETGRGKNESGKTYFCEAPVIRGNEFSVERMDATWEFERDRVPDRASATGHGGMDYFPLSDFVQCILNGTEPDIDVYSAVETAAPVIVAAASAEDGGMVKTVPDFRPGPERKVGQNPGG